MNFYMLVEGKSTEMKVYPRLISHFCPQYKKVNCLEDMTENSYYMFSGHGMPSLYDKIEPSLEDIHLYNESHEKKIEQFVICLDTDYYGSEEETHYRIIQELSKYDRRELDTSVIMQTMCIETWFLGNTQYFPETYSNKLASYVNHYNVSELDPELMRAPESEGSIEQYSKQYLRRMLQETGKNYSVNRVEDVTTKEYIEGIEERCNITQHIKSYRYFKEFIDSLQ